MITRNQSKNSEATKTEDFTRTSSPDYQPVPEKIQKSKQNKAKHPVNSQKTEHQSIQYLAKNKAKSPESSPVSNLESSPESIPERQESSPEFSVESNPESSTVQNSTKGQERKKPEMSSEKDKLTELHNLLVSMSDHFQQRFNELSESFEKKMQLNKDEINDAMNKKMEQINSTTLKSSEAGVSKQSAEENATPPTVSKTSTLDLGENSPGQNSIYIRSDKLIDLPSFNGKPSEWPMFIGQFNQTNKSHNYDDIQNNIRLNKALTGSARELVAPLLINPKNVKQIMQDLENRFGHPDLLVHEQLNNIRSFPAIAESETHMIISLADKVRNCKNFLLAADCAAYLDNPLLLKEISDKLPFSKRFEWARVEASLKPRPTLENMGEWLTEIAQYIHRINPDRKSELASSSDNQGSRQYSYQRPLCDVCKESHVLEKCQKFLEMNPEMRFEFAKNLRICFSCLKKGHSTKICRNKRDCDVENCIHKHHPLLHTGNTSIETESSTLFNSGRIMRCNESRDSTKILFQMIPIKIYGSKGSVETFAMFDSGADISIMTRKLANLVGIDGPEQKLNIKWLDNDARKFVCKVSNVDISGTFKNAPVFKLHNVRVMDQIEFPTQSLNMEDIQSRYSYLSGIPVDSYENARPDILLSLKEFRLTLTNEPPIFKDVGPIATKTKLGWMIYGATDTTFIKKEAQRVCMTHVCEDHEEDLDQLDSKVQRFISSDEFGCGEIKKLMSEETKRSFHLLNQTSTRKEDRFECGLLWRNDGIKLPNNFTNAVKRFESIEKKMEKDPEYKKVYEMKIEEYIRKGYAIELSPEEIQETNDRTWYLPHFGVLNKNKPGKFRLVFDAAAKFYGTSLNSNLLCGPDLNEPLINILFKFREKQIAVCGDIKEMFHQIKIKKEDQDSQRFIFRKNRKEPLSIYKMQVLIFGASCAPTIAQFIKNKNAEDFKNNYPQAADTILSSHYVDDYVCCFDSESEAIEITKEVINIHNQGGFKLRGFLSNSRIVMNTLNSYQLVEEEVNMDVGTDHTKILGLHWSLQNDHFTFKANLDRLDNQITNLSKAPTKRIVLSIVMSLFDPFGFVGNFTINGKLLLRSIWNQKIGWDEEINGNLLKTWKQWFKELPNVEKFKIPRCHSSNLFSSTIELHVFVDASSQAFAAVAYYRIINPNNEVTVSLVISKTKCSPIKYVSIPRLELQAAVLGARLSKHIVENQTFKIQKCFFWSDSTAVLHWIKNKKEQYKPFVANRISEILEISRSEDWYKIPTKENIADQATRASENPSGLIGNDNWVSGPVWLSIGKWPAQTILTPNQESEVEVKRTVCIVQAKVESPLITYERFSNYLRLVRAIAWVNRFIDNCRGHKNGNKVLSSSEINKSELMLCMLVQKEVFCDEFQSMKNSQILDKSSKIYNLNPILDADNVVRVFGRIDNAPTIPIYTKRPIIMPKDHYVTELLVKHFHIKCRHQLQELTICEIRKKFWINDLRSIVRRVKSHCVRCKILYAKPRNQLMGAHPEDRLTPFIRPFTYTGVDYFGPVNVSIGRSKHKRWIAVFTCLTIRAVHTEIAEDLSSDSCIICLRNFINLRGVPKRMRSDNGSNFVGINNELLNADNIFLDEKVQNELAIKNIQWKFNTPSNPEAGGCWERMVGMIKRILTQSLKEVSPRLETLRSFLIEACNIINSRPLTHVPTTTLEEEPLTPNDFLLGDPNQIQVFQDSKDPVWTLRKQWKIANHLKNHFWKRFQTEYIPTLNKRSKNAQKIPQLKVGDLVLIADDNISKNIWPRGIVLETFSGKDGVIRSAVVKSKGKVFKRPVCKLAVIGSSNSSNAIQEI